MKAEKISTATSRQALEEARAKHEGARQAAHEARNQLASWQDRATQARAAAEEAQKARKAALLQMANGDEPGARTALAKADAALSSARLSEESAAAKISELDATISEREAAELEASGIVAQAERASSVEVMNRELWPKALQARKDLEEHLAEAAKAFGFLAVAAEAFKARHSLSEEVDQHARELRYMLDNLAAELERPRLVSGLRPLAGFRPLLCHALIQLDGSAPAEPIEPEKALRKHPPVPGF